MNRSKNSKSGSDLEDNFIDSQNNDMTESEKKVDIEIVSLLGLEEYIAIFDCILKFAKEDFKKFSTVASFFFLVVFWYIKTGVYCFILGKFSIYGISSSYIEINDNLIYEIISCLGFLLIILLLNMLLIKIYTNYEKVRYLIIICFIEGALLLSIIFLISYPDFQSMFFELKNYKGKNWINLIFLDVSCVIMINSFALVILIDLITGKDKKKIKKGKNKKYILEAIICSAVVLLLCSYINGRNFESSRKDYKYIKELVENNNRNQEKYEYTIDNEIVNLFAIVYEDKDIYMICPVYRMKNNSIIDKEQIKTIEKNKVTVFNKWKSDWGLAP